MATQRPARIAAAAAAVLVALFALAADARANGIVVAGDGSDTSTRAVQHSPVRLVSHDVKAVVRDQVAEVTVEQTFHNDAARQLEGTYLFPLPEGAVVKQFSMTMGDTMVRGEVVEAKKARAVYEGIVRRKKDPGLLEWVGRGLFRARVFPIEPKRDLTIRLTFQQVLPDDAGTLELRYPLASDRLDAREVQRVRVEVHVTSQEELRAVYSPTHRIDVQRKGNHEARVTYESNGDRQVRDLRLYIGRSSEAVGFSLLSHKPAGEDGYFMAVLAPSVDDAVKDREVLPKDVVFVLDTSGSMAGEKMEQARAALRYGVQTLRPEDHFNIVAFSSGARPFRDALVPASPDVRRAAAAWIDRLAAGGGTNIEEALQRALFWTRRGRFALVVFLTDGVPTIGETRSDQLVAKVAAANEARARIFTFGVGYDLDVQLLDRIAADAHGARDYVTPGEDIEIVTSRFFRKIVSPVMTDVTVDLGAGVYDVYPRTLPDLFAGSQVVLFGRYREGGERTISLSGTVQGQSRIDGFASSLRTDEGADFLPRLWANRKVAFLLDEIRLHGRNPELVDEVVRLATRHAFVTPYTSGLVLEEHAARDEEIAEQVETDNDRPYHESFGQSDGLSDEPFEGPANGATSGIGGGGGGTFKGRGGSRDLGTGGGGRKKFDDAVDDALRWLAAHQSPSGAWEAAGFGGWCDGRPVADPARRPDGADADAAYDIGVTGTALAAFLGAGYTNRGRHPYAQVVSRGLRYLKNHQDPEGRFGAAGTPQARWNQAAAALAMIEAYGMTRSPIFKGSAQRALDSLALLFKRDARAASEREAEARAHALLALHSARLVNTQAMQVGRSSPLSMDDEAFRVLRDEALTATRDDHAGGGEPWPTALGALARILDGQDPRRSREIQIALGVLHHEAPVTGPRDSGLSNVVTLVAFQVGGRAWDKRKKELESLWTNQHRDTDYCDLKGSWDPVGQSGRLLGRVYETAIRASCLEVFYRYARVYGAQVRGSGGAGSARWAAGGRDVHQSQSLRERKEATAESDAAARGPQRTRTVAGRTFGLDADGRWLDAAFQGGDTTKVVAFSEAWFTLARKDAGLAKVLALGDRLVVVCGGTAYEVVPAR